MNFIRKALLIMSLGVYSLTYAQTEVKNSDNINVETETSISKLVKVNTDFLFNEMYDKSLPSGKRLIELEPENANFHFRYGIALLQASPSLELPIAYLKKGSENCADKVDMFNFKEKKAPVDAIFYYGLACHRFEDVNTAIDAYKKFMEQAGEKNPLYKEAQLRLKQANNALTISSNQEIKSLEPFTIVNTNVSEHSSVVSFDGSALFFTSGKPWGEGKNQNQLDPATGDYYEDIYVSTLDNETWSEPKRMDFCLPTENEASVSISIDERRIYTYNSNTGNGDIYYTDYTGGMFNGVTLIDNKSINTENWQPHFNVSADGKTAFFSSENEPGGYGGLDIYMVKKGNDGTWGTPVNVGSEINSQYDEDSPFITFDNKYLYFASNGEKSIGGYDIFRSEWKDGKFSTPENLGTPINSTYDDLYYTMTADGINAFVSSFRKGGSGNMDIYRVAYSENNTTTSILQGRIYMADGSTIPENISIRLKCINCDQQEVATLLPRLRDGKFMYNLEKCKDYEIQYFNTLTQEDVAVQRFKTECENKYEVIEKELRIEVDGDKIVASQVYAFRGSVFDKETGKKMKNVKIEIQDEKGKTVASLLTKEDGSFTTEDFNNLKLNKNYNFTVLTDKEEYIKVSKPFSFTTDYERYIDIEPIAIEKATIGKDLGKVVVLNTIYYDLNSSYLRKDAKLELNKIVESMNLNPNLVIELRSHTDCRESEEYNQWLSDRRAERAAEYIRKRIKNGASRISGKGYGESELLNNCGCDVTDNSGCSEDQHQLNRRTEFIIVK